MENNEDFLADFPQEGQNIDEVLDTLADGIKQEEATAESLTEKASEEETKDEVPTESKEDLKKNDTWKQMREELEFERAERVKAQEEARKLETRMQEIVVNKQSSQPEFLTDLIGENPEVASKYQSHVSLLKEEIKRELIEEQVSQARKAQEEKAYWDKWTNEQFEKVGATDENIRNELGKIMRDYTPTDEQGNLSYEKGMKILNDLKKAQIAETEVKTQVKKNVADATVSRETNTSKNRDFVNQHDLRKLGSGWYGK